MLRLWRVIYSRHLGLTATLFARKTIANDLAGRLQGMLFALWWKLTETTALPRARTAALGVPPRLSASRSYLRPAGASIREKRNVFWHEIRCLVEIPVAEFQETGTTD